jgi:hypothetical protein
MTNATGSGFMISTRGGGGAIEHCISCSVTSADAKNICCLIDNRLVLMECTDQTHFAQVTAVPIHGKVLSICAVRRTDENRDCIAVLLRSFNAAIVSWNPKSGEFVTEELVSVDHDLLKKGTNTESLSYPPIISTDGVVAFVAWDSHLIVFTATHPEPFVVALSGLSIDRIVDYIFLSGYSEPGLAILHKSSAVWSGTAASNPLAAIVTIVGLDIESRTFSVLRTHPKLPFDCSSLFALENAPGIVMTAGNRDVVFLRHNSVSHFSLDPRASRRMLLAEELAQFSFAECRYTQLRPSTILAYNVKGECAILQFGLVGSSMETLSVEKGPELAPGATILCLGVVEVVEEAVEMEMEMEMETETENVAESTEVEGSLPAADSMDKKQPQSDIVPSVMPVTGRVREDLLLFVGSFFSDSALVRLSLAMNGREMVDRMAHWGVIQDMSTLDVTEHSTSWLVVAGYREESTLWIAHDGFVSRSLSTLDDGIVGCFRLPWGENEPPTLMLTKSDATIPFKVFEDQEYEVEVPAAVTEETGQEDPVEEENPPKDNAPPPLDEGNPEQVTAAVTATETDEANGEKERAETIAPKTVMEKRVRRVWKMLSVSKKYVPDNDARASLLQVQQKARTLVVLSCFAGISAVVSRRVVSFYQGQNLWSRYSMEDEGEKVRVTLAAGGGAWVVLWLNDQSMRLLTLDVESQQVAVSYPVLPQGANVSCLTVFERHDHSCELIVGREDGDLQWMKLPTFQLLFSSRGVGREAPLLVHGDGSLVEDDLDVLSYQAEASQQQPQDVSQHPSQICSAFAWQSPTSPSSALYLVCTVAMGAVVVYRSLPGCQNELSFSKVAYCSGALRRPVALHGNIFLSLHWQTTSGFSLFVSGKAPCTVTVEHGRAWIHSLDNFGGLRMITALDDNHFAAVNQRGVAFLCEIPPNIRKDAPLLYEPFMEPSQQLHGMERVIHDATNNILLVVRSHNVFGVNEWYPHVEYYLEVLDVRKKSILWKYPLMEDEIVTDARLLQLKPDQASFSRESFFGVSTLTGGGEEDSCKGFVYLIRLDEGEVTLNRKSYNGAITQLCSLDGNLFISEGTQVKGFVYETYSSLTYMAFYTTHAYVTSWAVFRNYLSYGDAAFGLNLTRWIHDIVNIVPIASDREHVTVMLTEFLAAPPELFTCFVDDVGNMEIFQYDPQFPEMLSPVADCNLGWSVTVARRTISRNIANMFSLACGTKGGTIVDIVPIPADLRRKCAEMEKLYTRTVPQCAGGTLRSFRWLQERSGVHHTHKENFFDASVLECYYRLDRSARKGWDSRAVMEVADLLNRQFIFAPS